MADEIEQIYHRYGIRVYFGADDNFFNDPAFDPEHRGFDTTLDTIQEYRVSPAYHPLAQKDWFGGRFGLVLEHPRIVSLPAILILGAVVILKGANFGIKLLYGVVATLFLSLVLFFVGTTDYASSMSYEALIHTVQDPSGFFLVFAICFPAFTGMTARLDTATITNWFEPASRAPVTSALSVACQ